MPSSTATCSSSAGPAFRLRTDSVHSRHEEEVEITEDLGAASVLPSNILAFLDEEEEEEFEPGQWAPQYNHPIQWLNANSQPEYPQRRQIATPTYAAGPSAPRDHAHHDTDEQNPLPTLDFSGKYTPLSPEDWMSDHESDWESCSESSSEPDPEPVRPQVPSPASGLGLWIDLSMVRPSPALYEAARMAWSIPLPATQQRARQAPIGTGRPTRTGQGRSRFAGLFAARRAEGREEDGDWEERI
ncbi:hypothetical protein FKW77_007343 [Venturia effusa]|uniref:Uncharacterized protein n=1 Tax=Venturia effusa TaxID=50376 RepID=A0A517KZP9_9PEZI|nr:hypothetical protein FKW77_007343 [Venturia effusa]